MSDEASDPPDAAALGPEGRHGRILLLLSRAANRRQLADWLSEHYETDTEPDDLPAALERCDLCLLDEASFRRHREVLSAGKDAARPVFLPYLLVRTDDRGAASERDFWALADDVIETPIEKAELRARIEVLLRARGYSVTLRRQNERLESFADVVSHDLRNPLNIAQGRLRLAREECDSDHLAVVARAHDRMEALVEDLLQLAREGQAVERTEPVDLAALAEACWETVDTADATLRTDVDRTIRADRSRLRQLLENLVRNAIEHGGADVTVTVGDFADGFYVADDGPGVPAEKREQVFESGHTTSEDGTGFGLAIVEEIATAHGWAVRVTDSEDGGARFEITGVEFVG